MLSILGQSRWHYRLLGAAAGLCIGAQLGCVTPAAAQQAAPRALDIVGEDAARIATLRSTGVVVEGQHVVAWFPRDSLPAPHRQALVDSLDAAIPALQAFLGGPYPWQRLGGERITFYYGPGRFVSHARDGAVHIPVFRVREGTAPHLHEAVHVLLSPPAPHYPWEFADSSEAARVSRVRPLWLIEGLADLTARSVAEAIGFHEGDVQSTGGPAAVDAVCVELLGSRRAAELLPYLGGTGTPARLFTTERAEVAPLFYACAHSFTRYLAELTGAPFLSSLFPALPTGDVDQRIRERTGRPTPELRTAWLKRIGAPSVE